MQLAQSTYSTKPSHHPCHTRTLVLYNGEVTSSNPLEKRVLLVMEKYHPCLNVKCEEEEIRSVLDYSCQCSPIANFKVSKMDIKIINGPFVFENRCLFGSYKTQLVDCFSMYILHPYAETVSLYSTDQKRG